MGLHEGFGGRPVVAAGASVLIASVFIVGAAAVAVAAYCGLRWLFGEDTLP